MLAPQIHFARPAACMPTKVDLHVHGKYSDRPSEWILRRIGAPESFVEPHAIYRTVRQRSMQFVTLSAHNCIDGALANSRRQGDCRPGGRW